MGCLGGGEVADVQLYSRVGLEAWKWSLCGHARHRVLFKPQIQIGAGGLSFWKPQQQCAGISCAE